MLRSQKPADHHEEDATPEGFGNICKLYKLRFSKIELFSTHMSDCSMSWYFLIKGLVVTYVVVVYVFLGFTV